jgi:hypothetical protein
MTEKSFLPCTSSSFSSSSDSSAMQPIKADIWSPLLQCLVATTLEKDREEKEEQEEQEKEEQEKEEQEKEEQEKERQMEEECVDHLCAHLPLHAVAVTALYAKACVPV